MTLRQRNLEDRTIPVMNWLTPGSPVYHFLTSGQSDRNGEGYQGSPEDPALKSWKRKVTLSYMG